MDSDCKGDKSGAKSLLDGIGLVRRDRDDAYGFWGKDGSRNRGGGERQGEGGGGRFDPEKIIDDIVKDLDDIGMLL